MLEPKPNVNTAVPVQRALYPFQTLQVTTDSGTEPPLLCIVYFLNYVFKLNKKNYEFSAFETGCCRKAELHLWGLRSFDTSLVCTHVRVCLHSHHQYSSWNLPTARSSPSYPWHFYIWVSFDV